MTRLPIRVVKVGCSLFERRQLPERLPDQLRAWLKAQPPANQILLAGGGALADSIRTWDERFQLEEANSHWLCIEALSITAQVLQHALPEFPLVRDFQELRERVTATDSPAVFVFDVQQFLRKVEPNLPPESLPHSWKVTTDSIAARLSEVLEADELVLLKSKWCPDLRETPKPDFAALATDNFVDEYFPTIAPRLKLVTLTQL